MKKQDTELSIKDIFNIFVPKLWLIAIVAVACAAAFGIFTATRADTYTSTSTFLMVKIPMTNSDSTTTGLNSGEIDAMQSIINSTEHILSSRTFCNSICDMIEGYDKIDEDDIRNMLSMSLMDDTTNFAVTIRTTDAELSKAVADAVYKLFPEILKQKFGRYAIAIDTIDPPELAKKADDKGTLRNALIGFLAGVFLSAIVVFAWVKFDVIIRGREKIEESCNVPILGVIPKFEIDN